MNAAGTADVQALVDRMRSGRASPEVVNRYYTLCIPFYREFLGEHWHTGFYAPGRPVTAQDALHMEQVVAASAAVGKGTEVLDVGCGIGGPACHLALLTGARVRGLTPNPQQLQLARAAARVRGIEEQVSFDAGDASHLPYPDASFDVVLFFESACHFDDRPRFFAEAWRVLRPGGRLAGEDWLAGERVSAAVRDPWSARICETWAIPALGTVSGYRGAMSNAGFDVELALDMRDEMEVARGFMHDARDRALVGREMQETHDPIRRIIMEGLLVLGEAVEQGAFTIGRFLAHKRAV